MQITSLQRPPDGWEWSPEQRAATLRARTSRLLHAPERPPLVAVEAAPTTPDVVVKHYQLGDWTAEQDALIWEWAGLETVDRIAERCSQVGPKRTPSTLRYRASQLGIPLKKRWRRNYEKAGWQPEEEALLRDLAGTVPVAEITRRLNERFGTRRRAGGVQARAGKLGVSTRVEGLMPACEVRVILGVGWAPLLRFLRSGLLPAARPSVGPGGDWGIAATDLRAFLAAHPDLVRWRDMPEGPWRELARAAALRSDWLTTVEYQRLTGQGWGTIHRLIGAGMIPGAKRQGKRWLIPREAAISPVTFAASRPKTLLERLLEELGPTWRRCTELAGALGTRESGIYTAVKKLRGDGHAIEYRYGRGYRLRPSRRAETTDA